MNLLMLIALIAIAVAGLAAILGIWVERDPARPKIFAYSISVVIVLATGLTILQSYLERLDTEQQALEDAAANEKLQGDLARMMQTLDKLAAESDDPALLAFLSTELEAQARANPEVINKIAQREADEGRDPSSMLGKHLTGSEMEKIARSGKLKTQPKASETGKEKASEVVEKDKEKKEKSDLPAALRAARGPAKPAADGEEEGGGGMGIMIPGLPGSKGADEGDGEPKPTMGAVKLGGRDGAQTEEEGGESGGIKLPFSPGKGSGKGKDEADKGSTPPPPPAADKGAKGGKSGGKGGGIGGFGKPGSK